MKKRKLALVLLTALPGLLLTAELFAAKVPKMSKEELKSFLGNPDVLVIDVRTGADWAASEFKIKGALREDASKVSNWIDKYPRDKTIVFYCA